MYVISVKGPFRNFCLLFFNLGPVGHKSQQTLVQLAFKPYNAPLFFVALKYKLKMPIQNLSSLLK